MTRSGELHEGCGISGDNGRGEKGIEIKSQLKAALETDYFVILRIKSHCVCFFVPSPSKRMAWPIFLSYKKKGKKIEIINRERVYSWGEMY